MKSARLLLLMACFLVATSLIAAAYEPTNSIALDTPDFYATKTMWKEEVAYRPASAISENQTVPVVPIPGGAGKALLLMNLVPCIFKVTDEQAITKRDHRVSSRFT